jgi:hypothetical protein
LFQTFWLHLQVLLRATSTPNVQHRPTACSTEWACIGPRMSTEWVTERVQNDVQLNNILLIHSRFHHLPCHRQTYTDIHRHTISIHSTLWSWWSISHIRVGHMPFSSMPSRFPLYIPGLDQSIILHSTNRPRHNQIPGCVFPLCAIRLYR